MIHKPTAISATDVEPANLHAAFGLAFSDYLIGPMVLSLEQWPHFLSRQGIQLSLSTVLLRGDQVQAFALVAPRPELPVWRLGTMGAIPAARGTGAAPMLLDDFIRRAEGAAVSAVELEVFAQNERALRLYRSRGFVAIHTLHGYRHAASGLADTVNVRDSLVKVVDPEVAMGWIEDAQKHGLRDLPLQVTPIVLRSAKLPLQAWICGSALVVFSLPDPASLTIACLIDRHPGQRDAQLLLAQLTAAHPLRAIHVPELQRLDVGGGALRACGFSPTPLHQLLMRRAL